MLGAQADLSHHGVHFFLLFGFSVAPQDLWAQVRPLLREGLAGAPRTTHVEEIRGEFIAIDAALARLQPGDLCLVLVDQVEEALAHLAQRCADAGPAA